LYLVGNSTISGYNFNKLVFKLRVLILSENNRDRDRTTSWSDVAFGGSGFL
jgi:hypothetical protein